MLGVQWGLALHLWSMSNDQFERSRLPSMWWHGYVSVVGSDGCFMHTAAGPFRRKPPWTEMNRIEAEALLEFGEKVSVPLTAFSCCLNSWGGEVQYAMRPDVSFALIGVSVMSAEQRAPAD